MVLYRRYGLPEAGAAGPNLWKILIVPEGRVKRGDRAIPVNTNAYTAYRCKSGIWKSTLKGSFPRRSLNELSSFEMASNNDSLDRSRMYRRDGASTAPVLLNEL
jgi:hypothetical protein